MSSSEPTVRALRRWRLDLAYDGTTFQGFADQPGAPTVVGSLRGALARQLRLDEPPLITGAGRTDAGVHAFAQVVHVDLPTPLYVNDRGPEAERLMKSLNRQLAGRVVVLSATEVTDEFHARFSASWRAYRYLVVESEAASLGFTDSVAWTVTGPLDLDAMNEAATAVLGTHDFRSFCRRPANATTDSPLLREVLEASWRRVGDPWALSPAAAAALRFDIRANAFCHQMVRSLTSAMVALGQGRLDISEFIERLSVPQRHGLPSPAPASGLALMGVGYPQLAGGPSGFVS